MARPELFPPDRGLQARMLLALLASGALLVSAVGGLVWLATTEWWGLVFFIACLLVIGAVGGPAFARERSRRDGGRREATREDEKRVAAVAHRLALVGGLPTPEVRVEGDAAPLSWIVATPGHPPRLMVTTGLVDRLGEDELAAVVAHELGHVANRDALVMTLVAGPPAAFLAGVRVMWVEADGLSERLAVPMFGAWFLPLVALMTVAGRIVSRHRELAADRVAALLTGSPAAVAAALLSVSRGLTRIPKDDLRAVAPRDPFHLVPARAVEATGVRRLWATHPRLQRRLDQLHEMEAALQRAR